MAQTILGNLRLYFGDEFDENETLLSAILNKVIANVKLYRKYPEYYTQEMIDNDLLEYASRIEDIVIALFNRVGAEGTFKHHENSITDDFVGEEKLYDFILPIARIN